MVNIKPLPPLSPTRIRVKHTTAQPVTSPNALLGITLLRLTRAFLSRIGTGNPFPVELTSVSPLLSVNLRDTEQEVRRTARPGTDYTVSHTGYRITVALFMRLLHSHCRNPRTLRHFDDVFGEYTPCQTSNKHAS